MKRGKKLLLLLTVFILLTACSLLVPRLFPEEDTSLEADENTGFNILTLDSEAISAISWTYENETMMFDYVDENWVYAMDAAFPTNSQYLETMILDLSDLIATKTISDPGDLADYGLDEPACSISITENSTTEILIGDTNAIGDSRYISIGDGNVYLTDAALYNDFSYTLTDLIQFEEIPDLSTVTAMTVSTSNRKYALIPESSDDITVWYYCENNNKIALDDSLTDSFIDTVRYLSWNSCVDYNADDSTLSDCGLLEPALTVTITYELTTQVDSGEVDEDGNTVYDSTTTTHTFSLELSGNIDDCQYARISDSNMIYQIDEDIYTTLANTTADDLQEEESD